MDAEAQIILASDLTISIELFNVKSIFFCHLVSLLDILEHIARTTVGIRWPRGAKRSLLSLELVRAYS